MIKYILIACFLIFCILVKSQPYITSTVQISNPPPCTLCCNGSVSTAINGFSCALGPLQVGIQSAASGTTITWGSGNLYNLCNGTYTVYIDFLGAQTCGAYLVCYPMYLSATKLDEKSETNLSSIKLFPNPANDILNIELDIFKEEAVQLKILNNLGQIVREEELTNNSINIKDLPNGIYFINLKSNKPGTVNKRFIINR